MRTIGLFLFFPPPTHPFSNDKLNSIKTLQQAEMALESETRWWYCVQNILQETKRSTELLTTFKNNLYTSDFERDRRLFQNLYCFQCRGLCQDKIGAINQLRSLSRELDQVLFAINDVLFRKCLPAGPEITPPPSVENQDV